MEQMTHNEQLKTGFATLTGAGGAIEAGLEQQERLDELTERLASGEFHVATDVALPAGCIDGRLGGALRPNTAGGSESLMVADDLTTRRFAGEDGSTLTAYANTLRFLADSNLPIGGHDDEHAGGEKSGCGANDKLPQIYQFLADNGHVIRETALALGVEVDDATHEMITGNAAARQEFSAGSELLGKLAAIDAGSIDHLRGDHNEVVAVINGRPDTTLDRQALASEFGDAYEAFNVDVWSFAEAARAISLTPEEQNQKIAAMVYYNLATAHVLCGPNMRVVTLE